MLKRLTTGALLGLAASLSLAPAVRADVVTFNSITTQGAYGNTWDHGGLSFSGYQFYLLPPDFLMANPSTFPSPVTSTVLATWVEPMAMTLTAGGAFDFQSVSTALGWYNLHPIDDPSFPNWTDTETITGQKAGCVGPPAECTVSASFQVGYSFVNHLLPDTFTNLSSVTFGTMTPQTVNGPDGVPIPFTGFIGFDDITVSAPGGGSVGVGEPVPEPAGWIMMIAGFAGVGAMIRRGRRGPALARAT